MTVDAGMEFVRCPTCGTLRIPSEKLIHHTVFPDSAADLSFVMRTLFSMRMLWLRNEIPALRDKRARIADVGCGDGQFLQHLKTLGYAHSFGIEPDEARAKNARSHGVPVFPSPEKAAGAGYVDGGVNVMFIWQVLEHIGRPAAFLRAYTEWLAPGGCLIVSVPNQRSIQTRLFGFYSAYPDYGRHVWYHDRPYVSWLREILPDYDIGLLRDRNFEYEVFSWVDSIGSYVAREQNFIHRALKKGEGGRGRRLLAAASAVALLPFATVLSAASLLSGSGSTLSFRIRRGTPA
jgi:SAM-dependent methyltransferase